MTPRWSDPSSGISIARATTTRCLLVSLKAGNSSQVYVGCSSACSNQAWSFLMSALISVYTLLQRQDASVRAATCFLLSLHLRPMSSCVGRCGLMAWTIGLPRGAQRPAGRKRLDHSTSAPSPVIIRFIPYPVLKRRLQSRWFNLTMSCRLGNESMSRR